MRKTPAATIVAECSRALTGVGPSMASGSQVCRGSWALLPAMPAKISRLMIVSSRGAAVRTIPDCGSSRVGMSKPPATCRIISRPMNRPTSPMRVMTKALVAASRAAGFSYQNPMRKKEERPTSSQKMNDCSRSTA